MGKIQIRGRIDWDSLSTGRVVIFSSCFAIFLEAVIPEIKCDIWSSLQIITNSGLATPGVVVPQLAMRSGMQVVRGPLTYFTSRCVFNGGQHEEELNRGRTCKLYPKL